jgi:2-oxoisovalerate dehydrogenase E2 component (dihydrolipoyl transacylase)
MTTRTIDLPQVGESVTEGLIVKWLKQPGDQVSRYEPLVEVETDKVTMEVPSPVGGKFLRPLVKVGDTVQMGAPICEVEEEAARPARASRATIGTLSDAGAGVGATGAQPKQDAAMDGAGEHTRLSPVVMKLASENKVPLDEVARIKGTGIEGRVTKQDMLAYLEQRGAGATPPVAPAPTQPVGQPSQPPPAAPPAPAVRERAPGPDETAMPLSPVRRRIAENMVRATRDIPTAWTVFEADVTGLVAWRRSVLQAFEEREGVHLTFLPFILKAAAESLREHPKVNSTWGGDKIILKRRINVGIAVAAEQGLVVPVVHDADQFSIAGLARKTHELILKTRENRLSVQEVQNGTFTLNNAGALGSQVSHAIINYPQAAILTIEAIVRKPVAIGDAIGLRDRMNLTITFDHRIMDGHEAGAFMASVKKRLEAMGPEGSLY